ncbi:MAG: hypothetical protein ACP5NS_02615 [Candidatus Pacearchaeota archaeon]
MKTLNRNEILFLCVSFILILLTFATHFYGGADILDYLDSAKFFANDYSAKIRLSHSYAYGLIHSIPVGLTESFIFFKITSLLSLFGIVYSVYRITNRDKRALWLILLSPIVWYMSPWASPIQLASLIFLWGYFQIKRYDSTSSLKNLIYAGLLIGFSWVFWDGIFFFFPLIILSFFYDKKLAHSIFFIVLIFVGAIPRLALDTILLGSPFIGIIRHFLSSLIFALYGGIYNQGSLSGIAKFLIVLVFFPIHTYLLARRDVFERNRKSVFFIILSTVIIILNSQIRFILILAPMIFITLIPYLTNKQVKHQLFFSAVIILITITPYIIQVSRDTNITEVHSFLNVKSVEITSERVNDLIVEDLSSISEAYPDEVFIVGDNPDSYRLLANLYWGDSIKEFVSLEDYNLEQSGNYKIFEKVVCNSVIIAERREFCFSSYIRKASNDMTDYNSIKYLLTSSDSAPLESFKLENSYSYLNLFVKI